ncbi:carbonic anhydrase [Clostridium saccharoperbutylacetonicum]
MKKRFGTALNCIDGRTQIPVINWLKENFDVDYVDLITEPGMDKVLAQDEWDTNERLKKNVIISITAHKSNVVAVVGHYDCAANPVSDSKHFKDIIASTRIVKSWGLPVTVVGLWVDESEGVHVVDIYIGAIK